MLTAIKMGLVVKLALCLAWFYEAFFLLLSLVTATAIFFTVLLVYVRLLAQSTPCLSSMGSWGAIELVVSSDLWGHKNQLSGSNNVENDLPPLPLPKIYSRFVFTRWVSTPSWCSPTSPSSPTSSSWASCPPGPWGGPSTQAIQTGFGLQPLNIKIWCLFDNIEQHFDIFLIAFFPSCWCSGFNPEHQQDGKKCNKETIKMLVIIGLPTHNLWKGRWKGYISSAMAPMCLIKNPCMWHSSLLILLSTRMLWIVIVIVIVM